MFKFYLYKKLFHKVVNIFLSIVKCELWILDFVEKKVLETAKTSI